MSEHDKELNVTRSEELAEDLRQLYRPPFSAPAEMDQRINELARKRLAPRPRILTMRHVLPLAAAAMILIGLCLTILQPAHTRKEAQRAQADFAHAHKEAEGPQYAVAPRRSLESEPHEESGLMERADGAKQGMGGVATMPAPAAPAAGAFQHKQHDLADGRGSRMRTVEDKDALEFGAEAFKPQDSTAGALAKGDANLTLKAEGAAGPTTGADKMLRDEYREADVPEAVELQRGSGAVPIPEALARNKEGNALPDELRKTYTKFAAAMQTGNEGAIREFCLPNSVTFTQEPRKENPNWGHDLNLSFAKNGFSAEIQSFRQDAADCWLIRTNTTAMWFVETKSIGWKLYFYLDKPIE